METTPATIPEVAGGLSTCQWIALLLVFCAVFDLLIGVLVIGRKFDPKVRPVAMTALISGSLIMIGIALMLWFGMFDGASPTDPAPSGS